MIRLALKTEPVTVPLAFPYVGVTVTVKRLTSPDYRDALARAMATMRDPAALAEILERCHLVRSAKELKDAIVNPATMAGLGEWLGAVECGVEAITAWTGIADPDGNPVPVSREAIEVAMLDDGLCRQLIREIDAAARILAVEAGFSSPSVTGGVAAPPKAEGQTESGGTRAGKAGASTAGKRAKRARKAAATPPKGSARKSRTPRAP